MIRIKILPKPLFCPLNSDQESIILSAMISVPRNIGVALGQAQGSIVEVEASDAQFPITTSPDRAQPNPLQFPHTPPYSLKMLSKAHYGLRRCSPTIGGGRNDVVVA